MSRQVVRAAPNRGVVRGGAGRDERGDPYLERLLKLIPAETVAVYLFVQGMLMSALQGKEEKTQLETWLWGVFLILLVGNFLYLRRFHRIKDWAQYLILTLAFIVWVLALGGPFAYLEFYRPFMGSVIMVLFTFFVPVVYTGVEVSG